MVYFRVWNADGKILRVGSFTVPSGFSVDEVIAAQAGPGEFAGPGLPDDSTEIHRVDVRTGMRVDGGAE